MAENLKNSRAINQAKIERRTHAIAEATDEFEDAVKRDIKDIRAMKSADNLMILAEDMTLKALKAVKGKSARELIAASAAARYMASRLEWLASEYLDTSVDLVHQAEDYLWQSIEIAVHEEKEGE